MWDYLIEAYCVFPFLLSTYLNGSRAFLMDSNWQLPLFAAFSGLTLVTADLCFKTVTQAMEDGFTDTDELPDFFFLFFFLVCCIRLNRKNMMDGYYFLFFPTRLN